MKTYPIIVTVFVLFFTNSLRSQDISLFNGKNLEGWTIYGTEKWYVEDGLLVSESGPDKAYGYLGTDKHYKNFELTAQFKQEADGNSGVFIRSTVEGTKVSGWQVEVAPKGKHTGGVYESYGRGWLIKPEAEKEKVLKEGEWNTLKIRMVDDTLTTWLNGTQMIQLQDEKIGKGEGSVALQIHDGGGIKIKWKNLMLKKL
ncbi:3-keto-disaccharide hydrolase [Spongiimicrobium salis]|uniref:3-keto-disaccharide hydrolase n=1 Tax=Spongiimicrobium salis TaxID=1667022 RepID=UPI00374D7E77